MEPQPIWRGVEWVGPGSQPLVTGVSLRDTVTGQALEFDVSRV